MSLPHQVRLLRLLSIGIVGLLVVPELGPGSNSQALGGLVLQSSSSSSIAYANDNLNLNHSGPNPIFDNNGVLLYPGSPSNHVYPTIVDSAPQQGPVTGGPSPRSRSTNYTQVLNTNPTIIDPTDVGTGHSSVSLSNSIPNNGTQAGNAGISYNPGSNVFSSPYIDTSHPNALLSITTATATFLVVGGATNVSVGVFLDAAGFVNGPAGSYVAVGLNSVFTSSAPVFDGPEQFQLAAAFAGSGTEIVPPGANFNTGENAPAGYDFEVIASQVDPNTITLSAGDTITITSTLTLVADPASQIELFPTNTNLSLPLLGVFAGGPVSGDGNNLAVPEPATVISLLFALPMAGLLYRRKAIK